MTKSEIITALRHYAILLDLAGEDTFRARAFENAARSLETVRESIDDLIATHQLRTIRGIGESVAASIRELHDHDTFADYERINHAVPPGVQDLLRVDGLGPKKARVLWQSAGITSLAGLEIALDRGIVASLTGFGAKTAERFRASLAFLRRVEGRYWRHHAIQAAESLQAALIELPGVNEVFVGGSLRRGCETIGDLDVLVMTGPDPIATRNAVLRLNVFTWEPTDGSILRGHAANGMPIELSVFPAAEAPLRKIFVTGSKDHVSALRDVAVQKGFQLTVESLIDAGGRAILCNNEEDVYRALGLEPVPPPLREIGETLVPFGSRTFPKALMAEDLRGILHCHTTYSDGRNTLRELAVAMVEKDYRYLGIADHSQAAAYARGLAPERVREQWREIDELNREFAPFQLLKGTEVDVLADGRLDYDDELLAGFDFVIASIHSGFNMTEEQATERLLRTLSNPHVDLLGHLTGRLLLERPGYPVNHEAIIAHAARLGKGIEHNCNPHRFDLDWQWIAAGDEANVAVPLCPDAHDIEGLWDVRYGLEVSAKGSLSARNCPSTWNADAFRDWCWSHG